MTWDKTKPVDKTIVADTVSIMGGNFTAISSFTDIEHKGVTYASPGTHKPGGTTALYVDSEANINTLATTAASSMAFDLTTNNLRYNNNGPYVTVGGLCPSGSKMIFYQDTAPIGWTIDDTLDDKLIYITKGSAASGETGGGVHSTGTWTVYVHTHTTEEHTLTEEEMPPHNHATSSPAKGYTAGATELSSGQTCPSRDTAAHVFTIQTSYAGSGESHAHGDLSYVGLNTWTPAANCFIICTKD